jgi:hypothetical protein
LADADLTLEIEAEKESLRQETADTRTDANNPFSHLLQKATAASRYTVAGHLYFEHVLSAFEAGQHQIALTQAQAARRAALQSYDNNRYLNYLLACLLISLIREKMGDYAGVIAILLTCKGTLEDHLGPIIGQQINPLLDALQPRWGEKQFQAALQRYREQMKREA